MSPMGLKGRSEVEVDGCFGGTCSVSWRDTVPEPDVSSVSTADVVSRAGVVTSVTEDKEWKVDCSPVVLAPDEKKSIIRH